MELRNKKWTDEELLEVRKEVLASWPTGKDIDLDEAIEYQRQLPDTKIWPKKVAQAKQDERLLIYSIAGHALVEETIEHVQFVERESQVDLYYIFADTYTRKGRYDQARQAIETSLKQGKSVLNGFPAVNHGLKDTRAVFSSTTLPVGFFGGSDEDPRLQAEMGLAAGCTCLSAHDLHDLVQHCKNYPLDKRIQNNQYINRLAGYYTQRGAPIHVHSLANMSGWEPPSIKIALGVLQYLLAAEQGVKSISSYQSPTFNLIQDVAAQKAYAELALDYLHRFGHTQVALDTCTASWLGAWPADPHKASSFVSYCALVAILSGATEHVVKSLDEGTFTPTKEGCAAAIKIARQLIEMLGRQRLPESKEVKEEKQVIESEVRAIVDKVLELGDGDAAVGEVRGVEAGVLDAAFSPWIFAKNQILPVRDRSGAIRYLDPGNLPLPKEALAYHREKIAERGKAEGRKTDLEMVVQDVAFLTTR